MKINVHIERIIVDGLPDGVASRAQLTIALQRELARTLRGGLSEEISAGGAFERIHGGTITLGRTIGSAALAGGIARAIHAGIGKRDAQSAPTPERRTRE